MSAVRNLAGRELNGRPLRIDSATNAPGEGFRRECLQEPGGLPSAQYSDTTHVTFFQWILSWLLHK